MRMRQLWLRTWRWGSKNAAFPGTMFALVASVVSLCQYTATQRQAVEASRESTWNDIMASLSSASSAVQMNAILRVVDYVQLASNYCDRYATLAQFISANTVTTSAGLQPYTSQTPMTKVVLVAAAQIMDLERNRDLGPWPVDLTHADLHGFSDDWIVLNSGSDLTGIDLREAVLRGIRIAPTADVQLIDAFLTCADLYGTKGREASLGGADLQGADLQGANLDFVDLSHVQHLTQEQARHTTYNTQTRWPRSLHRKKPAYAPWQSDSGRCTAVIGDMTDMLPGEGYVKVRPWTSTGDLPTDKRTAIVRVRAARDSPGAA